MESKSERMIFQINVRWSTRKWSLVKGEDKERHGHTEPGAMGRRGIDWRSLSHNPYAHSGAIT